jgi:UDP-hydrolysing UDP-N-acetyl-D-glucosamine 2-epimerase
MIGDGWDDDPAVRPGAYGAGPEPGATRRMRIAVVTGSRAEFGLLAPVMRAIQQRPGLELLVVAAGSHLVSPALSYHDIKRQFTVADAVPMQEAGKHSRADDVQALGKGVARFGRAFVRLAPDWVVVLGDRIEAFAAASAATIGGSALAHIHGGDRAEGVADEAMRHAITKLAHLHLAATQESAERIVRMGERPASVHAVGSPAIDGLDSIAPMAEDEYAALGRPGAILLMHPVGRPEEHEESVVAGILDVLMRRRAGNTVLALHPNYDPGRGGILRALEQAEERHKGALKLAIHMPREKFIGLLKRIGGAGGLLVGNSSAALIEAAALKVPAVDIGPRQAGRERAGNVVTSAGETPDQVARAIDAAIKIDRARITHPYGDGHAGERIAAIIASTNPHAEGLLRKRNQY